MLISKGLSSDNQKSPVRPKETKKSIIFPSLPEVLKSWDVLFFLNKERFTGKRNNTIFIFLNDAATLVNSVITTLVIVFTIV